jgi:hypothetical protein
VDATWKYAALHSVGWALFWASDGLCPRPLEDCCRSVDVRRDGGNGGWMGSGLGIRLAIVLLSCTIQDVSWSGMRNDVSRVAQNSLVSWGLLMPKEKLKKKPRQFGMDPATVVR